MDNHEAPDYLYWKWDDIVALIKDGKYPSKKSLSRALRGNKPIPQEVRDHLADILDPNIKLPRGGRPTVGPSEYVNERLHNAVTTFIWLWQCQKILIEINLGTSNEAAINRVAITRAAITRAAINRVANEFQKRVDECWQVSPSELKFFYQEFKVEQDSLFKRIEELKPNLPHFTEMTKNEVIEAVAALEGVTSDKLKQFLDVEMRKKS